MPVVKGASRKGISPVISEVILAAVTITLALLAVSYFLGVWNVEQEKFAVVPMLYMSGTADSSGTEPILSLHVRNEGAKEAVIIQIEIRTDQGSWVNTTRWVIPPGAEMNIEISDWIWSGSGSPPELVRGGKYRVVVYTEEFGTLFFDVTLS